MRERTKEVGKLEEEEEGVDCEGGGDDVVRCFLTQRVILLLSAFCGRLTS